MSNKDWKGGKKGLRSVIFVADAQAEILVSFVLDGAVLDEVAQVVGYISVHGVYLVVG